MIAGVSLPFTNGGWDLEEQVNVVIDRRSIYVEDERVANIEPLQATSKLQRSDELFNRLKGLKVAWQTANAGKDYPGEIQFWVDETTSAQVLKSVFMTAAFAGHPNQGYVLRRRDAPLRLQQLIAGIEIPGPRRVSDPGRRERVLGVALRLDDQVEIAWLGVGLEPPVERIVPLATLSESMVQLWNGRPAGIELNPERWEKAVVSIPDTTPFRKVAQLLDGLSAPRVKLAATNQEEAPVFGVVLKPAVAESARKQAEEELAGPDVRAEAPVTQGKIDPQAVQNAMRGSFAKLGQCYDVSLAKTPTLTGRLPIRFVIERSGRVSRAEVTADATIHDVELERCIVAHIKMLTFPQLEDGAVTVVYPLVLKPR